jgi:PAS domain-containing protein
MVRRDARILVGSDSRVIEASPEALELLGLTFDELVALPPGAMSLDQDRRASDGFEAAWEGDGRPPLVGSATIRLADGQLVRLRYLIGSQPDGTVEVFLDHSPEPVGEPPRAFAIGKILSAWRAAERLLEALEPGSPEWLAAEAETQHFKDEYRRLARYQSSGSGQAPAT